MSNATAMYRALEEIIKRFEILHRKFGEFFEAAQYLEERTNFGPSIKLGNHLDKNYFTVDFLDKSLIFRFSSALSETNYPVGIVTCLERKPDDESQPQSVLSISFSTAGKVSGIDKPDDFEDPLDICDTVTAVFIVSHCVYLTLRKEVQAPTQQASA